MIINVAPPQFRPVTLTLETRDELDKLIAVLAAVSRNCINHTPQLIRAATDLTNTILDGIDEGMKDD